MNNSTNQRGSVGCENHGSLRQLDRWAFKLSAQCRAHRAARIHMQDGNGPFVLQWHNRIRYSPSSRLIFNISATARVLYRGSAIPLCGMQFSRGAMRSCWGTPRWNYDFEEAGGLSIPPVSSLVIRMDQLLQSRIFDAICLGREIALIVTCVLIMVHFIYANAARLMLRSYTFDNDRARPENCRGLE
jgi:hypothetical protein